jgi:hypothetical protein
MLDLIVLGTVPGTKVTITFAQAALGFLLVVFVVLHKRELHKQLTDQQDSVNKISL